MVWTWTSSDTGGQERLDHAWRSSNSHFRDHGEGSNFRGISHQGAHWRDQGQEERQRATLRGSSTTPSVGINWTAILLGSPEGWGRWGCSRSHTTQRRNWQHSTDRTRRWWGWVTKEDESIDQRRGEEARGRSKINGVKDITTWSACANKSDQLGGQQSWL